MASNFTEHFQLNQWEPGDQVKREDFNEDNRKTEQAILAARKAPCCIHGTYVGNGGTVTVNLDFRPSFVAIIPGQYSDGGLLVNCQLIMGGPERQIRCTRDRVGTTNNLVITDNGFQITESDAKSGLTATNVTFHYYAFY